MSTTTSNRSTLTVLTRKRVPKWNRVLLFPFEQSKILITGANRGLGKAIALELIAKNTKMVWCASRHRHRPEWLKEELGNILDRVGHVYLDNRSPESIISAFKEVGDVNVVINNAAICLRNSILELTTDSMREEWETNFFGPMFIFKHAVGYARNLRLFVNIGSQFIFDCPGDFPNYAATKTAFYMNCASLKSELAAIGIGIQHFIPGAIDTHMCRGIEKPKTPPSIVAEEILKNLGSGEELTFLRNVVQRHQQRIERLSGKTS